MFLVYILRVYFLNEDDCFGALVHFLKQDDCFGVSYSLIPCQPLL